VEGKERRSGSWVAEQRGWAWQGVWEGVRGVVGVDVGVGVGRR
jgi:hypothetical protein